MFFLPGAMIPRDERARSRALIAAAAAAVGGTLLQPLTWSSFVDVNVALNGALGAAISLAAAGAMKRRSAARSSSAAAPIRGPVRYPEHGGVPSLRSAVMALLGVLTFCYSFVWIPLGLQDHGSANMFSSLRIHAGSNHYLSPTGLLQQAFHAWAPDSAVGEAFGGGT